MPLYDIEPGNPRHCIREAGWTGIQCGGQHRGYGSPESTIAGS